MSGGKAHNPLHVTQPLYQYAVDHSLHEPEILAELRAVTEQLPNAMMLSDPCQVKLLTTMLKISNAKRGIEGRQRTGESLYWK
jgi:predicted O-methyltransferase YrrM